MQDDFPTLEDFERLAKMLEPVFEASRAAEEIIRAKKFLTTQDVADYFGKSPSTVRRWFREDKQILASKQSRAWKIRTSDFYTWIESLMIYPEMV